MRPDPQQERMHINDIISGLDRISNAAMIGQGSDLSHGLSALRIGCEVFQRALATPAMALMGHVPWHLGLIRDVVSYAAASMDLVRLFDRIPDKQRVKAIRQHLAIVGSGYFGIAATKTNQQHLPSRVREELIRRGVHPPSDGKALDASRKTIELMVGMALLGHTADVSLEDSEDSSRADPNPDVIVTYNGVRIGIACKSISTANSEGVRERIREGVRQVTRTCMHGQCSTGIVLLDVSSLLDHNTLYLPAEPNQYWAREAIPEIILEEVKMAIARVFDVDSPDGSRIGDRIRDLYEKPFDDLGDRPVDPIVQPCVLVYGHSVMIGADETMSAPFYAKVLINYYFNDQSFVTGLIKELNQRLHGQGPHRSQ